jgi:hypothetical protein
VSDEILNKPHFRVDRHDHGHVDAVLADLMRLTSVPVARALLDRLRPVVRTITIVKPPPMDPTNAWVTRENADAPGDMRIHYDPRDWPNPAFPNGPSGDALLYSQLLCMECWLRDGRPPAQDDATLSWEPYVNERDRSI